MRLETCIKPRKDGVVNVNIGGVNYTFLPDDTGALVADIEDKEHLAYLLQNCGDNFMPFDPDDFVAADKLAAQSSDEDEDDLEDDDDEQDANAAPIEEPTSAVVADQDLDSAPIEEPASAVAADPLPRAARKKGAK